MEERDTVFYLGSEPAGTFLIRFSRDQLYFAASYVNDQGVLRHVRIGRQPSGEVTLDGVTHPSVAAFVAHYSEFYRVPYRNDNRVSSTQEGDEFKSVYICPI